LPARLQHEHEAQTFLTSSTDEYAGSMSHPDQTRLIRFGRYATKPWRNMERGTRNLRLSSASRISAHSQRKWGSFVIGRKTINKRARLLGGV
jgi:RNA-directed DNA polymerase